VRREIQVDLVRRVLDLHRRGTTDLADAPLRVPATDYTSADVLAAEQRVLLRDRAVAVCLGVDVAQPGDVLATTSGGVPLLLVRDADGTLRAFVNACRHRASPLADLGCTSGAQGLTCRFHGWTYGLDGALRGRPYAGEAFAGIAVDGLGLLERPLAEAHGLVVVRPGGGDAPVAVDPLLGDLVDDVTDLGLERWHRGPSWSGTWRANWKLLLDTFLESYHVFALHKQTVGRWFVSQPSTYDVSADTIRFQTTQKSLLQLAERPESEWDLLGHATVEYLVGANFLLSHSVDHVAAYRFVPEAPDRTRVELVLYTESPIGDEGPRREHYERTLALHVKVATDEDFHEQERIQANLASGAVPEVLFGRNEPAAAHLHRRVHELLAAAPPA
jgi:phenylpropionate dioxygenase-like ring-hydroxylating dioxygenase large terminal subunit